MHTLLRFGVFAFAALGSIVSAESGNGSSSTWSHTDSGILTSALRAATSINVPASAVNPSQGNGTCVSRTANDITHTLPQQCLRTDRLVANATTSSTATNNAGSAGDSSRVLDSNPALDRSVNAVDSGATPSARFGSDSEAPDAVVAPSLIASSGDTAEALATTEIDSPFDGANFLSFEEWKRQNQVKAEQAADPAARPFGGDRQRPINNALDSFSDEGEIELDFSGFGGTASSPRQQQAAYRTAEGASTPSTAPESYTPRSKDAGKTCKERTNYASFDCAATVLKTNPECKSASSVLIENKDSYMLNLCAASNKFFIVELCNDILIDTVVLANYEFFSSIFRQFRVSVSDRYPVKMDKWKDLGMFEARNTREVQAFLIKHPQIWARYLRIEMLSHYGSEYYCPVSLLRVHGTTMLEEIRPQEDVSAGEDSIEEETLQPEVIAVPPVSQEPLTSTKDGEKETLQAILSTGSDAPESILPSRQTMSQGDSPSTATESTDPPYSPLQPSWMNGTDLIASVALPETGGMTCAANTTSNATQASAMATDNVAFSQKSTHAAEDSATESTQPTASSENVTTDITAEASEVIDSSTLIQRNHTSRPVTETKNGDHREASSHSGSPASTLNTTTTTADLSSKNNGSASSQQSTTNSIQSSTATASTAPLPQPSTQESFFKSVHKRLQQLEANSTLSLQYIEEQSRILRDAFTKVEKRQISATTTFLTNLNETVMTELRGFRQAYDQLWQGTVIELEGQREHYQRELFAISTRLTLVADELVWQKRLGIIQSTLVLLCLGFVLFSRGGSQGYFEVPLVQQVMNKSQTSLSHPNAQGWESPPASPSPENRSPVSLFRRKLLWRSITDPGGGQDSGTDSRPQSKDGPSPLKRTLDVRVEPPTPDSKGILTPESECAVEDEEDDSVAVGSRERPRSSPNLNDTGLDVT